MTLVVGTAGHIDHGKTTLLRALTGIDADRLPEERRRGMTIDVGYAHLALADGSVIDFVDVPGHDRLIGNMLVGAGEIDAVLLVVAADDGPRAQTLEHLELVDALGLRDAVVAVTKADVVDPARVAAVAGEVRAVLARSGLAAAPILPVSGVTGAGMGELVAALAALDPPARRGLGSRLAIDRVFSVRGRGAVVTGTLRGEPVARGDGLIVEPGGSRVRVREVQVHGTPVERSYGGRTALNLSGVESSDLHRGQVLATHGAIESSDRLLVALQPPAPTRNGQAVLPADRATVRLHLGTDQVEAKVGRSGREASPLASGRETALLRLDRLIAVGAGDRFVVRTPGSGRAAVGGTVLDAAPPRGVSRRRVTPERLSALDAAVAQGAGGLERLVLHGAGPGPRPDLAGDVEEALTATAVAIVEGRTSTDADLALTELRIELTRALRRRVSLDGPAAAMAAAAIVEAIVASGRLERVGDRVRDPARQPAGPAPAVLAAMDRLESLLDVPAPPPLPDAARAANCPSDAVRALEREGRIVVLSPDLAWSRTAWERLAEVALERAERAPLTPAALRDATGTSRKFVMALLEDLDRRGILARTPAGHVPGARAGGLRRTTAP